jgi:hypothetical protein
MLKSGKEPQINRLALELNGYLIQVKSQDFMRTIAEETNETTRSPPIYKQP